MPRTLAQNGIRRGRLTKTGQTTSYGSGTGVDDGAYEKGITKAYTVLSAGQYAGTTNIALNGKTDAHSNNCVLDNNTGLMWSRYVSASVGPASDGKLPFTTTGADATVEGIFPYAAAANAANLAGFSDWRVPNVAELLSIMKVEAPSPLPDTTAFPSFPGADIATSTTQPSNTANFMIGKSASTVMSVLVKTSTARCPLVRGG